MDYYKKIGNDIDIFQRNLLRKILKIRYPFIITNENLYKRTNEYLWTEKIKIRRLRWTGHLLRLPEKAPAKLALDEMMSCNKTYKKNNRINWEKTINKDLKTIDANYSIGYMRAERLAEDREWWDKKIVRKSNCNAYHRRNAD